MTSNKFGFEVAEASLLSQKRLDERASDLKTSRIGNVEFDDKGGVVGFKLREGLSKLDAFKQFWEAPTGAETEDELARQSSADWILTTCGDASMVGYEPLLKQVEFRDDPFGCRFPWDEADVQSAERSRALGAALNFGEGKLYRSREGLELYFQNERGYSLQDAKELAFRVFVQVTVAMMCINGQLGGAVRDLSLQLARVMVVPPMGSAANTETLMMGALHWIFALCGDDHLSRYRASCVSVAEEHPAVEKVQHAAKVAIAFLDTLEVSKEWRKAWHQNAFPRVEVGHKLAASLCLTDAPASLVVQSPWPAWSLVLPPDLLGDVARVWCGEAEITCAISRTGAVARFDELPDIDRHLLRNLVRGVCLAMTEPAQFQRKAPSKATKTKRERGVPDFTQARYVLSAPVHVDLREALGEVRQGTKPRIPKVQFLVRGHWRQQAHGPRAALRKAIWIQPFWKGPDAGKILLRSHELPKEET